MELINVLYLIFQIYSTDKIFKQKIKYLCK